MQLVEWCKLQAHKGNQTCNLLMQTIGSHWMVGHAAASETAPVFLALCEGDVSLGSTPQTMRPSVRPSVCLRAAYHTTTTKRRCLRAKTGGLCCPSTEFGCRLDSKHGIAQTLRRCDRSYHGDNDWAAQTRHFVLKLCQCQCRLAHKH